MHPKNYILLIIYSFFIISGCDDQMKNERINILILSGRNNHEWQKTTPVLEKMYKKHPMFSTCVTEMPDTLTYEILKKFNVILSNYNTWPDNEERWPSETEKAFEKYMKEGGGAVFVHAGASSLYDWKSYHQMGIGRWGTKTSHGKQTKAKIVELDQGHPITKGIREFYIMDEIWENTDIHQDAISLAIVTAKNEEDGHSIRENTVFISQYDKGRCFFTTLGHDERALFNTGLQTLLLRATEWVAKGQVTIAIPPELQDPENLGNGQFNWLQSDTTLCLKLGSKIIWQYNFKNRFGKPYFHPIYLHNTRITCESPVDHPWHHGLWFTWKFINKVNYWEFLDNFKSEETGYQAEGTTEIKNITIQKNPDFSVDIQLDIRYHPGDNQTVLNEQRKIFVSCPQESNGMYYFDYEHEFTAFAEKLVFDRTPILGEPDGKSWGGYGGLSIRFNQDFTFSEFLPELTDQSYPKHEWFYMGLNTLTGKKASIAMFQHPDFTTSATRWYYVNNPDIPFHYFSPAALYDHNITLKKGETLRLKYRVWILSETNEEMLQSKYNQFLVD